MSKKSFLFYVFPHVGEVVVAILTVAIIFQIFVRLHYAYKVRSAGNIHAARLGKGPLAGLSWLYAIGMAQAKNRLQALFESLYDWGTPECPNLVEINITGGRRFFFTREPEHVKTILTSKFADYGKGPEFHHVWKPFLGDSIFTTDHEQWQKSRNLIRPMFIKNRVSDLAIFERSTSLMLKQFPKSGQTFDIMDYFYRMTIDITTEFLLGQSVNSLQNPQSEFVKAFTEVQRAQMMLTCLLPIQQFVPRGKYNRGIKVIEDFIVPFIDRTLALSDDELDQVSKSEKSFTFLHALARYTRDPRVIRDQLIAVLLAGRDTTAATLSWTLYELSHYPAIYAKLRSEIFSVVGPTRQPTYEDLKAMKYLSHTLNETLRLYPAVPFNVRFALTDTTLPGFNGQPDITVVAGDSVIYSTLVMQRRSDLYPVPSAEFAPPQVFSPDRWDHWSPPPWTYVPFNGGPRICIGQNFALTEMAYVLVRVLQRYEKLEYRGDWEKQFHKAEIVGTPGRGVPVAFT
ncbi:cytochrome P450 [Leptodontidium sp. MPI-SDFR-AT-0119]|nr:cytochrome P450 [Leptodontidium sp. MPI-SDFR-AT-0119]